LATARPEFMKSSLLPAAKIHALLQVEPFLALLLLAFASWVLYKTLLRRVSQERHKNLHVQFANLAWNCVIFTALFLTHFVLIQSSENGQISGPLFTSTPYFGLLALLMGAVVLIKTLRILTLEYLFLGHMKVGVPMLLVNLFTLLFSLVVAGWFMTSIFGFKIAPLLATSAIFSVVLGLALQETLGQLFAGVSLQIDKPYEIGHWIEGQSGLQKWAGQVHEITWRATVLIGLGDELITIPNRVMAQAQIYNYTARGESFCRTENFKIAHGSPIEKAQEILLQTALSNPEVAREPAPIAYCTEHSEHGINIKLAYNIREFPAQFRIREYIMRTANDRLLQAGIEPARHRHEVTGSLQPSSES
jgi:small-conductance mechanosensitive channel